MAFRERPEQWLEPRKEPQTRLEMESRSASRATAAPGLLMLGPAQRALWEDRRGKTTQRSQGAGKQSGNEAGLVATPSSSIAYRQVAGATGSQRAPQQPSSTDEGNQAQDIKKHPVRGG